MVLNASVFGQPRYANMGYVVTDEPMMRLRLDAERFDALRSQLERGVDERG